MPLHEVEIGVASRRSALGRRGRALGPRSLDVLLEQVLEIGKAGNSRRSGRSAPASRAARRPARRPGRWCRARRRSDAARGRSRPAAAAWGNGWCPTKGPRAVPRRCAAWCSRARQASAPSCRALLPCGRARPRPFHHSCARRGRESAPRLATHPILLPDAAFRSRCVRRLVRHECFTNEIWK